MPQITSKKNRPRQLLTVKDVAELDNCSEKTVRRAIVSDVSAYRTDLGFEQRRISGSSKPLR
uniref:hypothetical protein n=1 Tax=uncultured Ruegeria sp. TaxID=259304 RepID=UPI00262BE053